MSEGEEPEPGSCCTGGCDMCTGTCGCDCCESEDEEL